MKKTTTRKKPNKYKAKTRTLQEATAIKNSINSLHKKLGIKRKAKIKRTKDLQFEVF